MILVWFRNDIRLLDNTAWLRAQAKSDTIAAVYIDTPRQDAEHDVAPIKLAFKHDNLDCLAARLQAEKIELIRIEVADYQAVPEALLALCQQYDVAEVIANREYAVNEEQRDKACAQLLRQHGITLRLPHDQAIVPPGQVLTQKQTPYTVFTPFYKAWLKQLPQLPETVVPTTVSVTDQPWPPGESEALRRLAVFIEKSAASYQQDRDYPALDGTSGLSPYLAIGVISARMCLSAALAAKDSAAKDIGLETWIKELAWRDFYIHILHHFPRVSRHRAFKENTEAIQWRDAPADFTAWCEGQTGIPIVDAAMRQLNQTGWMHNRLRMVVAMFLTKQLLIDWRLGERYFMQKLIDGHLASNNGGWQWAASTGTDAAPYFRIFNPIRQSERYDADGEFIRRYIPELAGVTGKAIHMPNAIERQTLAPDYPAPIVDLTLGRERALAAFKAVS